MSDDLYNYLDSIHSRLLVYLDADGDLSLATTEHLYRYAVAILQGHIVPEHVREDWGDFFYLADAFVVAYGTKHLDFLYRRAALLGVRGEREQAPLSGDDRRYLVEAVRELGDFVSARQSTAGGGTTR